MMNIKEVGIIFSNGYKEVKKVYPLIPANLDNAKKLAWRRSKSLDFVPTSYTIYIEGKTNKVILNSHKQRLLYAVHEIREEMIMPQKYFFNLIAKIANNHNVKPLDICAEFLKQ
jgi:hypothetical protein